MLLLSETEIKMLGETILEAIDTKLAPIIEKVEKIERLERVGQPDLENLRNSLKADLQVSGCDEIKRFKDDTDKKFRVTAKLIDSAMNALEQTTRAQKCEADIEGLKRLGIEPQSFTLEHAKKE